MSLKLKVELTVRIEEENFNVTDLRDIVRDYLKTGQFTFNDISFVANYRDEVAQKKED